MQLLKYSNLIIKRLLGLHCSNTTFSNLDCDLGCSVVFVRLRKFGRLLVFTCVGTECETTTHRCRLQTVLTFRQRVYALTVFFFMHIDGF